MNLFVFLLIAVISAFIIYAAINYIVISNAVRHINGPSLKSLFLQIIRRRNETNLFEYLQKCSVLYPKIFKAWFLAKMVLVIDDCDVIQRILTSREMLHKPSVLYNLIGLPFGLVGSEYKIWRRHRKILNPTFNAKILESFVPIFVEKSRLLVENLEQYVGEPSFDLMDMTTKYTLESTFGTTMGFEGISKTVAEIICGALNKMLQLTGFKISKVYLMSDFVYKWSNFYNGLYEIEQKTRKILCNTINEVILTKQSTFDRNLIQDEDSITKPQLFINQLISQSEDKQSGGVRLSNEEIQEECYTMVAGGTETTALTISYMAVLLAQNPVIQEKLFEEIQTQYPTFDEPLTMEILNRMTYLEMVIKETLRLVSSVPFVAREVKEDFNLGPCTVKPGMLVAINIFSLHRRKDIWGEDADEFDPDRFLPENVAKRHPFSYIPFSAGARNCIGSRYAMISTKIMMIYLFKNYKFSTQLKLSEFKFCFTLTLKLYNKHLVEIQKRD